MDTVHDLLSGTGLPLISAEVIGFVKQVQVPSDNAIYYFACFTWRRASQSILQSLKVMMTHNLIVIQMES